MGVEFLGVVLGFFAEETLSVALVVSHSGKGDGGVWEWMGEGMGLGGSVLFFIETREANLFAAEVCWAALQNEKVSMLS